MKITELRAYKGYVSNLCVYQETVNNNENVIHINTSFKGGSFQSQKLDITKGEITYSYSKHVSPTPKYVQRYFKEHCAANADVLELDYEFEGKSYKLVISEYHMHLVYKHKYPGMLMYPAEECFRLRVAAENSLRAFKVSIGGRNTPKLTRKQKAELSIQRSLHMPSSNNDLPF